MALVAGNVSSRREQEREEEEEEEGLERKDEEAEEASCVSFKSSVLSLSFVYCQFFFLP